MDSNRSPLKSEQIEHPFPHRREGSRDDPRRISRTHGSGPKPPSRPSIRSICGGERRRGGRRRRRWARIGRRKPKGRGSETKGARVWKGIEGDLAKTLSFFFPSLSLPFFSSPTMYTAEYTAPFSRGKMEARHVSHVRPPTPFSKSDQLSSATCQEWRYRRL